MDWCRYALGYSETEKKNTNTNTTCRSYKILRFMDIHIKQWGGGNRTQGDNLWYEIYHLDSGSWTTLDVVTPHWSINYGSFT
uniref:Putative F-box protein n=1 Tax=Noccaea caerulescens TaxID=107243 RepID=A0A1J3D8C5_NOCCA